MGPELEGLLKIISGLGVGAGPVMALFYFLERRERLELRKERDGLLREVLTANAQQTQVLGELKTAVAASSATLVNITQALERALQRGRR